MIELASVILVVLILDGIVSAAEAALLAVHPSQVEAARLAGRRGAETLSHLKKEIERPLGTLIVLSNIITIMGAFVVGVIAGARFGDTFTGIVSALLTFLVIVFAEIVPKILGERYAEGFALFSSSALNILTGVFAPLVNFAYRIA